MKNAFDLTNILVQAFGPFIYVYLRVDKLLHIMFAYMWGLIN